MSRKPLPHPRATTAVDRSIAKRILNIRHSKGVSQELLGELVGVTFQQIQKYERGTNRIAASRLYAIAKALETPVQEFFGE